MLEPLCVDPRSLSYASLIKPGKVIVEVENGVAYVEVSNFEFADSRSCRDMVLKGMLWARDIIDAQIRTNCAGRFPVKSCNGSD